MRSASVDALKKLDPRVMAKNPVMFIVEVGSLLTTILFLRDQPAKERLKPMLLSGNVDKTMSAPVVAIVGAAYAATFAEAIAGLETEIHAMAGQPFTIGIVRVWLPTTITLVTSPASMPAEAGAGAALRAEAGPPRARSSVAEPASNLRGVIVMVDPPVVEREPTRRG